MPSWVALVTAHSCFGHSQPKGEAEPAKSGLWHGPTLDPHTEEEMLKNDP